MVGLEDIEKLSKDYSNDKYRIEGFQEALKTIWTKCRESEKKGKVSLEQLERLLQELMVYTQKRSLQNEGAIQLLKKLSKEPERRERIPKKEESFSEEEENEEGDFDDSESITVEDMDEMDSVSDLFRSED